MTTAAPLFLDAPAAPFHAVTVGRGDNDELWLVERLVPADEPFRPTPRTVLARSVTAFKVQYRDAQGLWTDRWEAKSPGVLPTPPPGTRLTPSPGVLPPTADIGLPTAVRIELTVQERGQAERSANFVVPIVLAKVAA